MITVSFIKVNVFPSFDNQTGISFEFILRVDVTFHKYLYSRNKMLIDHDKVKWLILQKYIPSYILVERAYYLTNFHTLVSELREFPHFVEFHGKN